MFELSHEANVAYQICSEAVDKLIATTVKAPPRTLGEAKDVLLEVNRQIETMASAFELFVAGACTESRKKGVFPTVIPPQRKQLVATQVAMDNAPLPVNPTGDGQDKDSGFLPQLPGTPRETPALRKANNTESASATTPGLMGKGGTAVPIGVQAPGVGKGEDRGPIGLPSYLPTTGSRGIGGTKSDKTPALGIGCCNTNNETVDGVVATALYIHFETLVRQTLAREAALYVYQAKGSGAGSDEAQAIAVFGGKPRPPNNVKLPIKSGVVGAVMRSGIAVSVNPDSPSDATHYALCFPVFAVTGRAAPIAAVMLEKKAGNIPFSKEDEQVTHQWCKLVSHLLMDYGVNLTQVYYDPYRTLLKTLKPLQQLNKRGQMQVLPKWMSNGPDRVEQNVERLMAEYSGTYSPRLAAMVSHHSTKQLIFHTVHHNHFTTLRGANIGGSGVTLQTQNLMDVADYVTSLEECWKRAADDLQGMEVEHVSRMDDFRERKKKLKASQIRMGQLESVCDHYKSKYESIKQELTVLCGAPVDDELDHPPPNVVGGLNAFAPINFSSADLKPAKPPTPQKSGRKKSLSAANAEDSKSRSGSVSLGLNNSQPSMRLTQPKSARV